MNAVGQPRECQTEDKSQRSIENMKSKPFQAMHARSILKDYTESIPIVTPPDESESREIYEKV